MKALAKKAVILLGFFLFSLSVFSQEVGIRFGDIVGNNVAIDAVFEGGKHRQHMNLSFGSGIGVEWLFDFVVKTTGVESLDYYIGAGGFIWLGDPLAFGVCGELGLEYRFYELPLVIGLDWRPTIPLYSERSHFIGSRFGLNIRYVF